MATTKYLFSGLDGNDEGSLWTTDGTPAGTTEYYADPASQHSIFATNLTFLAANKVVFVAEDSASRIGLWTTNDGTASGTFELSVAGASTGPGGLRAHDPTAINGLVLFGGIDAKGNDGLWSTDGTSAGTKELQVSGAASSIQFGNASTVYKGKIYFSGFDKNGKYDLWSSDGSASGTLEIAVSGQNTNDVGLNPMDFQQANGLLFFSGRDTSDNTSLWVTDGTSAGTKKLHADFNSGFGVVGNHVLFATLADGTQAAGLWTTDGTVAGTHQISVTGASTTAFSPYQFTSFAGLALFEAPDASGAPALWASDGTSAGTYEEKSPMFTVGYHTPLSLTVLGPKLLFVAVDAEKDLGVFSYDSQSNQLSEIYQAPSGETTPTSTASSAISIEPGAGGAIINAGTSTSIGGSSLVLYTDGTHVSAVTPTTGLQDATGAVPLTGPSTDRVTSGSDAGAGSLRAVLGQAQSGDTVLFDASVSKVSIASQLSTSLALNIDGGRGRGTAATAVLTGSGKLLTSGSTTVSNLTIGGSVGFQTNGAITQAGNLTVGDASNGAAQIAIRTAATWQIAGDFSLSAGSKAATVDVAGGSLLKSAGAGLSVIAPNLTNDSTAAGTVRVTSGSLELAGSLSGSLSLGGTAGTTLILDKSVAVGTTASFTKGLTLQLNDAQDFAGRVTNFGTGANLDLRSIASGANASVSYGTSGSSGTLTVSDGSHTAHLSVVGSYTAGLFHLGADGHGGSLITYG